MGQEEEKKVKFSATDNGFTAFMQKARAEFAKTKKEAQGIYQMFADEAKKQNLNFRESKRFIDEQLKALREQLKVQKELTQEKLKQNREAQIEAARSGNREVGRSLMEEEAKLEAALKNIVNKGSVTREAGALSARTAAPKVPESVFSGVLRAELFRDLVGLIRQVPGARTGVDLVSPAFQMAGGAFGSLVGKLGGPVLGPMLGYLGKEVGGFLGDAVTRSRQARNEYGQALYGFQALTGYGGEVPGSRSPYEIDRGALLGGFWNPRGIRKRDLTALNARFTNLGFTDAEVLQTMGRAAGAAGGSRGAEDAAALLLGAERGYGINQGVTTAALGSGRFGGGSGTTNVLRALGQAVAEGIDRSRYADVVQGQTHLLEQLAGVSTTVDSSRVNSILFGLNRLGGEFTIGDRRAMGNVSALQAGLAEPGSAFGQAQNYALLRRLNPGANAWELRKLQQQGLQTPGFLEAVLNDLGRGTGGDEFKKFQLQGRFPGLSMAAIDTLWSGFKQTGTVSATTREALGLEKVESEAAKFTTTLQRQQAEIQNAFKTSFVEGIKSVASAFTAEMKLAISDVAEAFALAMGTGGRSSVPNRYDAKGHLLTLPDATFKPPVYGALSDSLRHIHH